MASQKEIFLGGEGNAYHRRNREAEHRLETDLVVEALDALAWRPQRVLEIGCGGGWRLALLRQRFGAACHGIDPSVTAVEEGRARDAALDLQVGTADDLSRFGTAAFDLVIFGFCLYLVDRADLFRAIAEADRVLADGGVLAVYDFCPPTPYANPYAHDPGVTSYKMDYAQAFLWNPAYVELRRVLESHGHETGIAALAKPDDRVAVSLLRKDAAGAYPANPYRR
jgi:ubiquinone/menaquinone biosynthesis C-methylase UbiE